MVDDSVLTALAFGLTLAGSLAFYLAAPRQSWLAAALPVSVRWASYVLLLGALIAWVSAMSFWGGLFAWLTMAMLLWSAYPYLGLLLKRERPR